ncbi:MAG: hypothetical protein K8T89_18510 [Planctomycetes bacterium]|nr:hypothetical protein [Planctomycetota bacterium]
MALFARSLPLIALMVLAGCGTQAAPLPVAERPKIEPPVLGTTFDPQATGTIKGKVTWNGARPIATSYRDAKIVLGAQTAEAEARNPLLPRIDAKNGVAGAAIYLKKVAPARSKPWKIPDARIEMKGTFINIVQGEQPRTSGFVKLGDHVEMVSRDTAFEMLRARGAAFFTLAFPDPDKPLRKEMKEPGTVEFCSAATNYWARCYLHVVEHPYWTHTDSDGRFVLDEVPDGDYEIVCWMPNWHVERYERDPELGIVARVWYRAPIEKTQRIKVSRGAVVEVEFRPELADFSGK